MPSCTIRRLLALLPGKRWLGLTLLALVACSHRAITVFPNPLQDITPIQAQVDPSLLTLTERWATGGTSGCVYVGALFHQVLVDNPQAPLRLTYVTSQLDVATVVSPTFYRPRAYQVRYRLIVRVESPTTSARQIWLQGTGESRSLASAARAISDAITQAVRKLCQQLATMRGIHAFQGGPPTELPAGLSRC